MECQLFGLPGGYPAGQSHGTLPSLGGGVPPPVTYFEGPSQGFFFLPYFQVPRNDLSFQKGFSSFEAVLFPRLCSPTVCACSCARRCKRAGEREKEHVLTSHLSLSPSLVLSRRWRTGAPILGREPHLCPVQGAQWRSSPYPRSLQPRGQEKACSFYMI